MAECITAKPAAYSVIDGAETEPTCNCQVDSRKEPEKLLIVWKHIDLLFDPINPFIVLLLISYPIHSPQLRFQGYYTTVKWINKNELPIIAFLSASSVNRPFHAPSHATNRQGHKSPSTSILISYACI